jgi:hypothetical protein
MEAEWQTYEYRYVRKTSDWFWALGIVALGSAITSVILENILFALVILIASFVLAVFAARPPKLITFRLTDDGLSVDTTMYPFQTLSSFWIDQFDEGSALLYVKSKRYFMPHLIIPLEEVNISGVRSHLSEHLSEEEQGETISDRIVHFLGL